MRRFSYPLSSALLALIFPLVILATSAAAQLQLGPMTYARAEARPLLTPVTRSATFFRSVGGVAFEAIAEGQDGLEVRGLRYDASQPDGQRLAVTVGRPGGATQTIKARIYDWELVPIARFAEDENGSAMTLFGRLTNKSEEERILKAKGRVINYHPKLDNTLVGLRLFHADILIIQPNAADLFKSGGAYLLGAGERDHNLAQNRQRFQQIGQWQQDQSKRGNRYQSYVVGDIEQRVVFRIEQGNLEFSGKPYWAAWRPKYNSANDQERRNQIAKEHDREVDKPVQDRAKIAQLRAEFERLNEVDQMTTFSRQLSDRIHALGGVNPVVYRTLTQVMHYRALFKHHQRRDRAGFAAFVRSLDKVRVAPDVSTPTVQASN